MTTRTGDHVRRARGARGPRWGRDLGVVLVLAAAVSLAPAVAALAPGPVGAASSAVPPEPPEPPGRSDPLRLMLVGDSVTHGFAGDWTWRYRLWSQLTDAGVAIDLVGHRDDVTDTGDGRPWLQHYADPDFDTDHAAVGGMRISEMRFSVGEQVRLHHPDVVVLMLGINDLLAARSPELVADHVARTVAEVRATSPGTDLVLAHAPQTWVGPAVVAFNDRLDALAPQLDTPGSRVVAAATSAGLTSADAWDRLHPDPVGEVKIARAVLDALATLGHTPPVAELGDLPAPHRGPVLPVTGLRAVHRGGDAAPYDVQLSWTRAPGATGHQVAHRDLTAGTGWTTVQVATPATSTTVVGLAAGHTHELAVLPVRGTTVAADEVAVSVRVGPGA